MICKERKLWLLFPFISAPFSSSLKVSSTVRMEKVDIFALFLILAKKLGSFSIQYDIDMDVWCADFFFYTMSCLPFIHNLLSDLSWRLVWHCQKPFLYPLWQSFGLSLWVHICDTLYLLICIYWNNSVTLALSQVDHS